MGKDTTFLSQISGNSYKFLLQIMGNRAPVLLQISGKRGFSVMSFADEFMEIIFICTSICDKDL